MWKNIKFSGKVSLLVTVFIIFSIVTAFGYHTMSNNIRDIGIQNSSQAMLDGYKRELKDIVDFTAVALGSVADGVTDPKERFNIYNSYISKARFFPDSSGYMFIYKVGGEAFAHPIKPQLNGKNLINLKDANGKPLIKELNDAALAGGGFVDYLWDKPGKGNLPKVSYARMIPGSQHFIGSGVYIDDITAKEAEISSTINNYSNDFLMKLYAVLGVIFFLIIIPLTIYMIKSMVLPLISLTQTAEEYSRGKLDSDFLDTDRKDEIGALANSVKRLGRSTKIVMDRLQNIS